MRRAAERGDRVLLKKLQSNVRDSSSAATLDGIGTMISLLDEFDSLLLTQMDNRRVHRLIDNLQIHMRRIGKLTSEIPGRMVSSISQHADIVSAVSAGDADGAERAMRAHIESVLQDTIAHMKESEDGDGGMRRRPMTYGRPNGRVEGVHHVAFAHDAASPVLDAFREVLGLEVAHVEQGAGFVERMLPTGDGCHVQLLEACGPGVVDKFVERRGPALHHVAFRVTGLDDLLAERTIVGCAWWTRRPGPAGWEPASRSSIRRCSEACSSSWWSSRARPDLEGQPCVTERAVYDIPYAVQRKKVGAVDRGELVAKALSAVALDRAVELCQEVVRIPSVLGEEGQLAQFLASTLKELDFEGVALQPVLPDRPNATGRVDFGPGRTVVLTGHLDTKPVSHGWTDAEPYSGDLVAGRVYGHGIMDMKAALAVRWSRSPGWPPPEFP